MIVAAVAMAADVREHVDHRQKSANPMAVCCCCPVTKSSRSCSSPDCAIGTDWDVALKIKVFFNDFLQKVFFLSF